MKRVQDNVWSVKGSKKPDFDFYSVLKPVTYYGYVTGTFLLTLKGRIGARKYSTSYVAIIYGVVIFSLIMVGKISLIQDRNATQNLKVNKVVTTSQDMVIVFSLVSVVAIFSSLVLGKEKLATVLNDIRNNDKLLDQIGIRLDYAKEFKRSYVRLGIYVSLILIISMLQDYSNKELSFEFLRSRLIPKLSMIWTRACTYLFIDVIHLLKERFRLLNEHFIKVTQRAQESGFETVFSSCRISAKVRSIALAHRNLCRSAMELNRIFSVTIVVALLYHCIRLLVSFYFIYGTITNPALQQVKLVLHPISNALTNLFPIILLVAVCTLAKNQASSTGNLIHEFKFSELDSVLNDAIQLFSLQLHHDKIEFTGLGLFPLDPTLVQSIAGTVTTYLIILVQFDTATENVKTSCEEAANE